MLDNVALTDLGENLKKGLEDRWNTVLLDTTFSWSDGCHPKYGPQNFDIIHINCPNFKKVCIAARYLGIETKLVCHWHGSDLRHPIHAFPVYRYLMNIADFHLYSTLDLGWWLRDIPKDRRLLFTCPIDTDLFRPDNQVKRGEVTFDGGGRSYYVHRIPHEQMPAYLNRFETVNVHNADGLDDGLLSVIALEAAACGCNVPQIPWLDREWVVKNASIGSQTEKLLEVYRRLVT